MANSKFEYVKQFEQPDSLLPNTWIVVRLDGRGFTKYVSNSFLKDCDIFSVTNKNHNNPDSPPNMPLKSPTTNEPWTS